MHQRRPLEDLLKAYQNSSPYEFKKMLESYDKETLIKVLMVIIRYHTFEVD